ncbi:MAG: hypothetical protein FWC93_05350 [Defluviitaleaceae bacterium]|nr:hypothetical protein [Defluviitaleaceae bacterium]
MNISEVVVISVDRGDDMWPIEGEAIFEGDFSTAFAAAFYPDDNEIENLEFDVAPKGFDRELFAEMLIAAISEFDEG